MDEHRETPNSHFSEQMDSPSMHTLVCPLSDNYFTSIVDPALPVHSYKVNRTEILLYNEDTSDRILSMTSTPDEERSKPFLQRVQLIGPGDCIVRATGQVDDGAMRNCISKRRWDQYGHCLSKLQPSSTCISVANGAKIKPMGRWFGTIKVGGIGAPSWFEVFDSRGAFDIILGKPWLHRVKAIHDYDKDQITITQNGNTEVISNSLTTQPTTAIHSVQEPAETSPREQLDREWARIHQIRASASPWCETRWAQHLSVDPMEPDEMETLPLREDEPLESGEIKTPLSEKERRRRHADEVQILRDAEGEILLANVVQEYEDAREYERLNKPKRRRKKRSRQPKTTPPPDNLNEVYLLQESERRIRTLHSKLEHL